MSTPWESSPPLGARYNLLRELGEGGFGRTYLAEDLHRFKEACVLKEFVPQIDDPALLIKAQELFEREAKILYQLQHPQIPKFRELMREEGKLFLVQDYVEGTTYRSLLQNRQDYGGHFSETEIVQLMYQLLPVLDYIHNLNIIHRDISPENLILRTKDGLPVLIDFGSVKQIAATVEKALSPSANVTRIGKVGYVPPEQFQSGAVDSTSDLYGLAATLVVMATGQEPQDLYDGYENNWNWERFVSLGEPLNQVLRKMLAPASAQRYQSANEVMQALRNNGSDDIVPLANNLLPDMTAAGTTIESNSEEEGRDIYASGAAPEMPESTQVVSPAPASTTLATPTAISPAKQSNGTAAMVQAAVGLLALLGVSSLLMTLLFGSGLRPRLPSFGRQSTDSDNESLASSDLTLDEVTRKQELDQRRGDLGVNETWLNQWVNQRFYQQYPDLKGRALTSAVEDAPLRLRWDNLAMDSLDSLKLHLSMPARRGLGAYGAGDRERWRQAVNRLNVSSRALEDLADAKFAAIFPEERRDNVLDQPIGQVWYALAEDGVEDLTSGRTLEKVEFESGTFSQRLTGQLAPGEGQVFILNFQAGQNLRLSLQAPDKGTLMSLYLPEPSQEKPFLLSDAAQTTWSGRLDQTGYYEIAIASTQSTPLNYALSIAVDNIKTTPPKEEEEIPKENEDTEPEDDTPTEETTPPDEAKTPEGTDTSENTPANTSENNDGNDSSDQNSELPTLDPDGGTTNDDTNEVEL